MGVLEVWQEHVDRGILKVDSYLPAWDRHLEPYRGRPVTVLEIGVNRGGSLQLWRHYFGDAARIVGVDIDPACTEHAAVGAEVVIGDQADRGFLEELAAHAGPFDVVIDGGGHRMEQQLTSFEVLWPHVRDGGVYLCEDTGTSYLEEFGGGEGRPGTFIEAIKAKIDELHRWMWGGELTPFSRTCPAIHVYRSLVVLEKEELAEPRAVGDVFPGTEGTITYWPVSELRALAVAAWNKRGGA